MIENKLIELAERCEKATGRSAHLDCSIHHALKYTSMTVPPFTASIDAAMTLLEHPEFRIEQRPESTVRAIVWNADRNVGFDANAATPALALCAAALRARAAKDHP